jgi:Arc/MetJ-type ribon-helix-helix transcriptional regulator
METTLKRTTILLTEMEYKILRRLALKKRMSLAELVREAVLEFLEDEEDISEGLKALADEEGTITWEQYQGRRADKESQGGLSG